MEEPKGLIDSLLESLRIEIVNRLCIAKGSNFRPYKDILKSMIRCHQIALGTGDEMGIFLADKFLYDTIDRQFKGKSMNMDAIYSSLVDVWTCVGSQDKVEAWAAYFVGKFSYFCEQLSAAISWQKQALSLATSNRLKLYASRELVFYYRNGNKITEALEFCEIANRTANDMNSSEQVFHALVETCYTLIEGQDFGMASRIAENLHNLAGEDNYFRGIRLFMQGMISFLVNDLDKSLENIELSMKYLNKIPHDLQKGASRFLRLKVYSTTPDRIFMVMRCIKGARAILANIRIKNSTSESVIGTLKFVDYAATYASYMDRTSRGRYDDSGIEEQLGLIDTCFQQHDLEKAESHAAQLLQTCQTSGIRIYISQAQMQIIRLVMAYNKDWEQNDDCWDIIVSLSCEAIIPTTGPNTQLDSVGAFAVLSMVKEKWHHAVKLLQRYLKVFLTTETTLENYSKGRIAYLEGQKDYFNLLQAALIRNSLSGVAEALVWAERGRARDLIYGISNRFRASEYKNDMLKFDTKEDEAWKEIQDICVLAGTETVFLVYSKVSGVFICYCLHANHEPYFFITYTPNLDSLKTVTHISEENLKYFFTTLIAPSKEYLELVKPNKLIIVPTEELSLIPFAALCDPDKEDRPFLIQTYAIACVPSLRLFRQCDIRRQKLASTTSRAKSALIVGNPTLGVKGLDLFNAEKEAEIVAGIVKSAEFDYVKLLKREEASAMEVLSLLPTFDWIHVASHAVIDSHCPRGAMLLAPSNIPAKESAESTNLLELKNSPMNLLLSYVDIKKPNSTSSSPEDCENEGVERTLSEISQKATLCDGKLNAEILEEGQDLKAMVAMLTGCSTGSGKICMEGILGLCRSFHLTGVPTVVMSLWNVKDKATQILMEKCYQNLKAGMEIIFALQAAINWMIEEEDHMGSPVFTPRHWAPFIVSGSPFSTFHSSIK